MPRPKNKEDLLNLSKQNFDRLFDIVNFFSEKEKLSNFEFDNNRDKNIRDVLTHLHEWHLMMMNWYKIWLTWEKPDMPAKWYTWKTIKYLNKKIWEKYQNTNFEESVKLLNNSFLELRKIIESHSDEELFTKKKYKWTGTTSMGSYFISATSSHYDWWIKILKQKVKFLKKWKKS